LAGFMEQGASLKIDGDLLTVTPRSDIYVRYLTDNRNVIADLASELYGRRFKVEIGSTDASASAVSETHQRSELEMESSPGLVPLRSSGAGQPQGAANEGASVPPVSIAPVSGEPQSDARQKLYADPVVRRIFEEFDARLVDLKTASIRPGFPTPSAGKK